MVPLPPKQQPPRSYRLRCSLKSAVSARRASRSWMGAGIMMPDIREGGILGAAILPLALLAEPDEAERRAREGEADDRRGDGDAVCTALASAARVTQIPRGCKGENARLAVSPQAKRTTQRSRGGGGGGGSPA